MLNEKNKFGNIKEKVLYLCIHSPKHKNEMKYIFKFIAQTLIVVFIFTPVVIGRLVWTFKWNDKFNDFPNGIYKEYRKCYNRMLKNINGKPYPQTF